MPYRNLIVIILLPYIYSCQSTEIEDKDVHLTNSTSAQTSNLWLMNDLLHVVWTEEHSDTTVLLYKAVSDLDNPPSIVSSGTDWFVNWADFSSIASLSQHSNILMTHWLEKSATGTYDYDIKISKSTDGGQTWSTSQTLHNDGISAEHGFVSVVPYDSDHFFAAWLDGRNTKTPDPNVVDKNFPMSLRGGLINTINGEISELELDLKVCDCCQTSCTKSSDHMLIAYRDRSDDEIRDIKILKLSGDHSEVIFDSGDNWKINGCPVNGPALASNDKWEAMAWYTAADSASVFLVYGQNASFDNRIKIDNGNPMGRVDVEIMNNKAYVSWLEMKDQRAEIRLKTINLQHHDILSDELITYTSPERRSGFPILKVSNNYIYLSYTEVLSADHTTVRLKKIQI